MRLAHRLPIVGSQKRQLRPVLLLLVAALWSPAIRAQAPRVEATALEIPTPAQLGTPAHGVRLIAAFELQSSDAEFGGLSSLLVEGDQLTTASDRGTLWTARLERDRTGRITGIDGYWRRPITLPPTAPRLRGLDVEGMTRTPDGNLLLSLEQVQALLKLDGRSFTPLSFQRLPAPFSRAPGNKGPESVTTWPDGRVLTIMEGQTTSADRYQAGLIGQGPPALLSYVGDPGFEPSDAQRLGARLFVLSRRFSLFGGFAARVKEIALDPLPTTVLDGPTIALIDTAPLAENYEGLSLGPAPDGGTFIYLISDDNFLPVQRTLLVQLEILP